MTTTTPIHPFEKAGLGVAPFRCTRVTVAKYQACHGAPVQPGASCDYCGTGIMNVFWIKGSQPDAAEFRVGCDCVAKTGAVVEKFRDERLKFARLQREAKRETRRAAREQKWAQARDERATAYLVTDEGAKVSAFLLNHTTGFLGEMNASLHKWGSLTPGQHAAVLKIIAQNEARAAAPPSSHQGEVGKALTFTAKILATREHVMSRFPHAVSHWHLMTDDAGNVYTFRGVSIGDKGETVTGTFTVKAHEEYKGTKQTVVQRPRKLSTVTPVVAPENEPTVHGVTMTQHVENNRANIERDAAEYAKTHGLPLDKARAEVEGEYKQGFMESYDDARYECTDGSM
jgi:hypothetical protein